MKKIFSVSFILSLLCGVGLLAADQITKYLIISNFELGESREFLKGFIELTYIHNQGGAWGMLSGNTWLLLAVSAAVMVICVAILFKYGVKNRLLQWALSLVIFGGIGNLIDRVFREGNVIDFLHFEFWPQFPVFNVADCAIVVGAGLLILYFVIDTVKEARLKRTAENGNEQEENAED